MLADNHKLGASQVDKIMLGSNAVWEKAGSETFTSSGTFIVPAGYTEVTICMCGGGGSGGCGSDADGGYAGSIISQVAAVTYGIDVDVVIGQGGLSVIAGSAGADGLPGSDTSFGAIIASGGIGGEIHDGYKGDGALAPANCYTSTAVDGSSDYALGNYNRGGQGSFGDGGDGKEDIAALPGGIGAGGGGSGRSKYSGAGGNGLVIVTWSY